MLLLAGVAMAVASVGFQSADHELVALVRHGRMEAFETLFVRHHKQLVRYLTYRTGDPELAADVAQEAFLVAFRDLDRLAEDRAFGAWLYGISRNHLAMVLRRRRLREFVSLDWLLARGGPNPSSVQQADVADACGDRDLLYRGFGTLSPILGEALLLHSHEGFTAPEVAQITGISLPAAERRISRAKLAFKRQHGRLIREQAE